MGQRLVGQCGSAARKGQEDNRRRLVPFVTSESDEEPFDWTQQEQGQVLSQSGASYEEGTPIQTQLRFLRQPRRMLSCSSKTVIFCAKGNAILSITRLNG